MSLRLRLLLTMAVVMFLAMMAADFATHRALRTFLINRVDASLEAAHIPVENAVDQGGTFSREALGVLAPGTHVAIRHPDGSTDGPIVVGRPGEDDGTPILPAKLVNLTTPPNGGEPRRFMTVAADLTNPDLKADGDEQFRLRVSQLRSGEVMFLAQSLERVDETTTRLFEIELIVTGTAVALATALAWLAIRRGLRPLQDVERTAQLITAGDLTHRVPGSERKTEVGHVADALNSMLSRIQDAFRARDHTEAQLRATQQRLRSFVADASHELRSPVAAVSAYAELFDRGAKDRPEDLAKVMTGIRGESRRMAHLVDELLLLARLDEGPEQIRVEVAFAELVNDAISAAVTVAPSWPITPPPAEPTGAVNSVSAIGDPVQLRQVIDNLLMNVRTHSVAGTATEVTLTLEAGFAVLRVIDHGPGIVADLRDAVFERFFRQDVSRSRASGGTGLGLAIVAAIVHSHNGHIDLSETPSGGATFTVKIPVATTSAS